MDRPTLGRALDSVASQIWTNLEIVVAAACGRSHRLLPEKYCGRPLRQIFPDRGGTLSRPEAANLCLEYARGDWLIFLDDDDEYCPDHLKTLMDAQPTAARVIYSRTILRDKHGRDRGTFGSNGTHGQFFCGVRSSMNATMFHRSLIEEGVRFDPDLTICEDYDFWINCASRTDFHFVPADTCIWYPSLGESGCGFGANEHVSSHNHYRARVQSKWRSQLQYWISVPGNALALGQEYLRSQNIPTAVLLLEQALVISPNDINALNLCGMANLHAGNTLRAESLLRRAIEIRPDHFGLRANLQLIRNRARSKNQELAAVR